MALLREKITLTRRDIAKMIEMALEETIPGFAPLGARVMLSVWVAVGGPPPFWT
jgi:hypothetical protein